MTHQEKLCFVISPIGDPDSETRKRSDQVLKHVVRPAATSCGYKAVRADEIDKPGMITSQVIQHGDSQWIFLIATAVLAIAYFLSRRAVISISSNGGQTILVPAKGMSRTSVIEFLEAVEREKLK